MFARDQWDMRSDEHRSLVMNTGDPWVKLEPPAPIPAKPIPLIAGMGFLPKRVWVPMGKGVTHGSINPYTPINPHVYLSSYKCILRLY
jgi:hypothetical protein